MTRISGAPAITEAAKRAARWIKFRQGLKMR
jgi:hypothetical protein